MNKDDLASFFFKRGRALFFPTVAGQLADKLPDFGHAMGISAQA